MLRHPTWTVQWGICILVLEAACTPLAFCGSQQTHPSERLSLQVGNVTRTYQQYLPTTYDGHTPLPLVLVFHGLSQGALSIEQVTGFSALAEREQFIVVYPIGIHRHWNDGRQVNPIFGAGNYDDIGFVKALLAHLQQRLAIDPNRIYATGMSNGGMFVQRLACELSDTFAAVAPVSGTLPQDLLPACRPVQPISVIEFHGLRDAYVHWDGGSVRALGGKTLSVKKTMAHWRAIDACSDTPDLLYAPGTHPQDRTNVRRERFGSCAAGTEVVLYAIEGGGHTWPGGPPDDSWPFIGAVTRKISATEASWEFFSEHPKHPITMFNKLVQANPNPTPLIAPSPSGAVPSEGSPRLSPLGLLTSIHGLLTGAVRNLLVLFW